MSTSKYILKMFASHIIAVAILVFMMISLLLIFMDNMVYQSIISVVMAAFYWIFIAMSLEKYTLTDARYNEFSYKKILIATLVFIIPSIILIILDIVLGTSENGGIYNMFFRYWNAGYLNFIILSKDNIFVKIAIVLSYFVGFALIYTRGMFIKKKMDAAIKSENDNKNTIKK